ncbi:unnamed protein product [Dicrocoelium dendriticum]|nr:unnamed protein product [Dicrocoelium dendriticum]
MGGGMSLIVPGLYVGGLFAAKSQLQLDTNNITHLCSVIRQKFEVPNRKQIVFEVDDSPSEDLSKHFENACFFIHDARASGGHVLVHCACGVSRSVTIALAYLLVTTDLPLSMLVKAIRGARHCACPNYGFMFNLLDPCFYRRCVLQRINYTSHGFLTNPYLITSPHLALVSTKSFTNLALQLFLGLLR